MLAPWPTDEIGRVAWERLDERFRRYRLVDAAAERAVRRSLERDGQLAPIVVWEQDESLVLIPIRAVLEQLPYVPLQIRGDQWRGPCPLHGSQDRSARCFNRPHRPS